MNEDFVGLEIKWAQVYIDGQPIPVLKDWRKHGMRRKFLYKNYIIKVDDRGYCDYEQSTRELKFWEDIVEKKDKKYFLAPVAGKKSDMVKGYYKRGWIAQPFINIKHHATDDFFLPNNRWTRISKLLEYLTLKYSLTDLHCNWVIADTEEFKILDWGLYSDKTN